MSNKAVRSQGWLEVPHHQSAIKRSANYLLKVRVEGNPSDCILVALERSLQSRIAKRGDELGRLHGSAHARVLEGGKRRVRC